MPEERRRGKSRKSATERSPAAMPLDAAGHASSKRASDGRTKERQFTEEILRELKRWIAAKEKGFGPGEMLPPVSALADRTGACRPTVRKALGRLADEGLIQGAGRGAFIAPTASATVILEGLEGKRVRRKHPRDEEILDCRRWLEPEAAVRATEVARMSALPGKTGDGVQAHRARAEDRRRADRAAQGPGAARAPVQRLVEQSGERGLLRRAGLCARQARHESPAFVGRGSVP
jgi:DNA-binding transcriptional MocR family regulator